MIAYVVDTHAFFFYLTGSSQLGKEAEHAFVQGELGEALLYVPAIVLAELYFLNEKLGQPRSFTEDFDSILRSGQFVFVPLQAEHVLDFGVDAAVSEMHDRIIVGVARRLEAPLLSRDKCIAESGIVRTIW